MTQESSEHVQRNVDDLTVEHHAAALRESERGESLSQLSPAEQQELAEILDEYLQQIENGEPTDSEALLARHPKYANILKRYLESLGVLHFASRGMNDSDPMLDLPKSLASERRLGDYELRRQIGRGGMGIVYEARQISLDRRVALKVLPFAAVLDKRQIARFRREAQAAAQLHHPHIVPVFGVGCEQGVHFYSMQLVNGQSLDRVIRSLQSDDSFGLLCETMDAASSNNGPTSEQMSADAKLEASNRSRDELRNESLVDISVNRTQTADSTVDERADLTNVSISGASISEGATVADRVYIDRVAELGIQAASALQHAHDFGVIHRDIKPSNLMLDHNSNLWVTDFGLAHIQSDAEMTATGDLVGTLRYMSPEQARGGQVIDQRTDVYSLGITLYELLTLKQAFPGQERAHLLRDIESNEPKRPRRLNQAIPRDLETVVLKATAKDRDQRYDRAQDFADDLQRYLDGKPTLARRPTVVDMATKWAYRHRGLVTMLVVGLIATLLGTSLHLLSLGHEQTKRELVTHNAIDSTEKFAKLAEGLDREPSIRREMLLEARQLYQRFVAANRGKEPFIELARKYDDIGKLSLELGDFEVAATNYRLAAETYATLAIQIDALRLREAISRNNLGQALVRSGDLDSAKVAYEHAHAILLSVEQNVVPPVELDRGLAMVAGSLGHLASKSGERQVAIDHLRRAIELRESLRRSDEDDVENRIRLASNYHNLSIQTAKDDLSEAEGYCRKAIALQQFVREELPERIEPRSDLALSWNNLGAILLRKRDLTGAAERFAQAAELGRELVSEAPKLAQLRHDLAISLNNFGKACAKQGDEVSAYDAYAEAANVFEALMPQFESHVTTMARYGGVLYNQAVLAHKLDPNDASVGAMFQRAFKVNDQAASLAPHNKQLAMIARMSKTEWSNWLSKVSESNVSRPAYPSETIEQSSMSEAHHD